MKKPLVAVVFGSRSTEHDISILTAIGSVIKPLELAKSYDVLPVYIAKDGRWYAHQRLSDITLYQSGKLDAFLAKLRPVAVRLGKGLTLVRQSGFGKKEMNIDVVFPTTHGTHGEDGELMAICEMAGVPYVGCDVESSVIAMDKVLAKQVAAAAGIPTATYVAFSKQAYEGAPDDWLKQAASLNFPVFVKPAHLGSSIGITRVARKKDLANAIEVALHYDTKALVEEAVQNLVEVTLPIMGNDEPRAALLEQPLLKSEDFFDFETKYMQGGKKGKGGAKSGKQGAQGYSIIPADLPAKMYETAEQTGLAVYRALGCSGMARVDMLIDTKTERVYFNEVNPLPGSLYAHNWAKAGVSNVQLVIQLIQLAQARWEARQKVTTAFTSSYLQQF
ncbi:MAG TPA: D-alanine--D-alanine ligase family protein [Candidatus Saccharimonadales bacterium]|nr:D-alanine--D-alanine ligase family protein [Candidatus Saccharimonadales bacterium]